MTRHPPTRIRTKEIPRKRGLSVPEDASARSLPVKTVHKAVSVLIIFVLTSLSDNPRLQIHKAEDDPVDIPSAFTSDDYPLKRRRSRTSDVLYDSES
jgi:hypothetical protein